MQIDATIFRALFVFVCFVFLLLHNYASFLLIYVSHDKKLKTLKERCYLSSNFSKFSDVFRFDFVCHDCLQVIQNKKKRVCSVLGIQILSFTPQEHLIYRLLLSIFLVFFQPYEIVMLCFYIAMRLSLSHL